MLSKPNPNLTINTGTVERHDSSTSSQESVDKGKGKPRPASPQGPLSGLAGSSKMEGHPKSPNTVARRLLKIAEADPFSTVTTQLSSKSSSHPNVSFEKGGGFLVKTEQKRDLTSEEIEAKETRAAAAIAEKQKTNPDFKPRVSTKKEKKPQMTEFKAMIEYHPAGGIHTSYENPVDYTKGGSYLRTTPDRPPGLEQRIGREGYFDSDRTFDHKKIDGRHPVAVAEDNLKPPPNKSDSPPPSPITAGKLVRAIHSDTKPMIEQLQSGRPYKEIAEAMEARTSSAAGGSGSKSGASGSKSLDSE